MRIPLYLKAILVAALSAASFAHAAVNFADPRNINNIPVTRLNNGTNASAATCWRGDGVWAPCSAGSMVYPGIGIPYSDGTQWGTSFSGSGLVAATSGVPRVAALVDFLALLSGCDSTNFIRGDGVCAVPAGGGGGGGGDVSSNTSVSVDGELALMSGASGKVIKRATGSGRPYLLNGVLNLGLVDMSSEVTGRLSFGNIVASTAAARLVGRGSASGAGDWEEISLGADCSMTGTTLNCTGGGGGGSLADGDYGSVSVSGGGSVITIDNAAVTLPMMANIATARLLGRNTAGTGEVEALSAATVQALLAVVPGVNVQAYDADLLAIAALSPTNDDIIQRKSGSWVNRSMDQLAADLLAVSPTIITESTTARTLSASDNDKTIRCTNGSGCIITIPTAFNGKRVTIVSGTAGAVEIVESGTTRTCPASPCRLNAPGLAAVISPSGTNTFEVFGAVGPVDTAPESIASAATTSIYGTRSNSLLVTGTTGITSMGTCVAGDSREGRFADALTLTHNGTSLILPNAGSNITTAAGDYFKARCISTNNTVIDTYVRANGTALVGGSSLPVADTTSIVEGSADATKEVRIEADGITTGTIRVWTAPDANTSIPVIGQTLTVAGPTAARTITVPDANFTAARTDADAGWADGVKQTFNPNGTNAGINVGSQAGDPSTPANGDMWYNSTANELTARINGANVALGAGGSSSPVTYGLKQGSATAVTATTSEEVLATLTIPDNPGANASFIVEGQVTWNNDADNKTTRCRMGGLAGTSIMTLTKNSSGGAGGSHFKCIVINRNAENSQSGRTFQDGDGGSTTTSVIDTGAGPTTLVITGQKADATDTLTLEWARGEVWQ